MAAIMEPAGSNLNVWARNPRMRVLLADDFAPFREHLKAALPASGNLELAGQAADGAHVVALARELRPDLIVMDYRMPGMDGVAAATRILEHQPDAAILISSLSYERPYVLRALAAGARGYLAKDDALEALPEALATILAGRGYVSPRVAVALSQTAPPNPLALTQQVLWTFDQEAPALLACVRAVAGATADAALGTAFLAYWMALRDGQRISDPQTWLLLSAAALLFRGSGAAGRWSFTHAHPTDRELQRRDARVTGHVAGCRTCHLSWTLAAHDASATADVSGLREELIRNLEVPDEAALFLAFGQRQAAVMRMAAAELQVLLGSPAGTGWMRRELSAGSWLSALLGKRAA